MTELLAFLTITVLAVISPGADFAMVSRNSLLYSRRAGLLTALGIGAGVTVHVGYSILGVGVLVRESLALFTALKLAGAPTWCSSACACCWRERTRWRRRRRAAPGFRPGRCCAAAS